MTRPSDFTRDRILKAATRLFAERGYEATSIRTLAAKARVNQAAINYHFKSKDGLYREILRAAIHALTEQQLSHAQETQRGSVHSANSSASNSGHYRLAMRSPSTFIY
jgi:AcrR family transcriptional regulator